MTIALIVIAILGYLLYLSNQNNNSKTSQPAQLYNGLVNEDKFRIDIVGEIKRIVGSSLSKCKEYNFSSENTNKFLITCINTFRSQQKSKAIATASLYRLPIKTVDSIIDEMCDGAIGNYVIEPLLKNQ